MQTIQNCVANGFRFIADKLNLNEMPMRLFQNRLNMLWNYPLNLFSNLDGGIDVVKYLAAKCLW